MGDYYDDPKNGLPIKRGFFARRALRRRCQHHDRQGASWIESALRDLGRSKVFWCTRCGKTWLT